MGFSTECIAFLRQAQGDVEANLKAAEALAPADVLRASGLAGELTQCAREGYLHFWMENLQQLGVFAEGRSPLPPEFWERLARAAALMNFDQFVPFLFGKARGKPPRSWPDLMAAVVLLHSQGPAEIWSEAPGLKNAVGQVVGYLASLDPAHAKAFASGDAKQISEQLGRYEKFDDEQAGVFPEFMRRFNQVFDGLFAFTMDPRLPDALQDVAWALISVCTFRVVLGGGTSTQAVPWWRA